MFQLQSIFVLVFKSVYFCNMIYNNFCTIYFYQTTFNIFVSLRLWLLSQICAKQNKIFLLLILSKKCKASSIFFCQLVTLILLFFLSCTKRIKALKKKAWDLEVSSDWTPINPPILWAKSRLVIAKMRKCDNKKVCGNEIGLQ